MTFPSGFRLDLDQHEFAKQWNSGTPALNGGSVVPCLSVPKRDDVDKLWKRMVDAGHKPRQMPYDAFWSCRFAITNDPDGYQIGLMSPTDADQRYWPSTRPPETEPVPANVGVSVGVKPPRCGVRRGRESRIIIASEGWQSGRMRRS